jgi:ribosomal protein S18 acetylase RimI-like enzyme
MLSSDEIWGEIFVLPYVDHHPEYAWVVEDTKPEGDGEKVVGYVVGTPDTTAYGKWYHGQYWPSRKARFGDGTAPGIPERERDLLKYASSIGDPEDSDQPGYLGEYPAHLHINLLPQAQGQRLGPRMIQTLLAKMAENGIKGLHLGAAADNDKACGFYKRIGMSEIPSKPGSRVFVKKL